MIKLPNGTISRTLAEQVGFNSAKIAEIIKFLNESGLKDLVINLESDSGTLSTDQYAIAELSPSYMVYDGGVFYKVFEDSDYIDYFLLLEKVDTSNSDLAVSKWRIRVERDSRNYALEEVNVFTSYNKSQLDSLFSQKANLAGATFTGNVSFSDSANLEAFENIVDKDGHKRFIEGNLTPATISGVVFSYSKWALCGSHLIIVLAGSISGGSTIADNAKLADVPIPQWILDKIYPINGKTVVLESIYFYTNEYNITTHNITLYKRADSELIIYNNTGSYAPSDNKTFRIEFDLLIDNE